MIRFASRALILTSVAFTCLAPLPALAGGGLALTAQTLVFTTGGESDPLPELGLAYGLGPKTDAVPVRVDIAVRDAFASGPGGPNVFSAGVTARLTSPLYFGAGVSLDRVSAPQENFIVPVGFGLPGREIGMPSTANSGIGGTFFTGQRLATTPNFNVSLEAGYRFLPGVDGLANSGADIGFRFGFR